MRKVKRVVYSCPFIPAEWIAAHGLVPSRAIPGSIARSPSGWPVQGVCPYARSFAANVSAESVAAVIFSTACDQMRRAYDLIGDTAAPKFLFNLPHTWEIANAQKLYITELLRLGDFLVSLGGSSPTLDKLAATMRHYDDARASIRDARSRLSPRHYSELIAEFNASFEMAQQEPSPPKDICIPSGVPLAIIGGPIQSDRFNLFDLVEKSGGYIALDATETGERALPAPFDRRQVKEDPMSALLEAYFGTIPDAFRRPNTELYRWLKAKLQEREVRGILFYRYVWCDTWHAEAQRLKEWSGLPFFDLDFGEDTSDMARTASRLQSFMEMLT